MGFRRIQPVVDFPELCQAAALSGFDLLVSEMGRTSGNSCELVKRLHHSTFGVDPFPRIVTTAVDPQATQIQKAIKAGPDQILKCPFSDEQLAKRVRNIVDQRRPFVVTIDYIGSDRRTELERFDGASLIQVPNVLRAESIRDIRSSATPESIAGSRRKIDLHRIRRCYPAIRFMIERIRKTFEGGDSQSDRAANLAKLGDMIGNLKIRIEGTDFADSTELCVAMANVADKIRKAEDGVTASHFELLKHIGMALHMSFEANAGEAKISAEVSSTVALLREGAAKATRQPTAYPPLPQKAARHHTARAMIVLFTDFGPHGPYTGQIRAVLAERAPGVPVIELVNDAPACRPKSSAYLLAALAVAFPTDAVFLCVIDPGVGGAQAPVVVVADGRRFVGPGNGLFEIVARRATTRRFRTITWMPERLSASFHGRDLFAPVAAMLANGTPVPSTECEQCAGSQPEWPDDLAEIVYTDHFGNAMTGLRASTLPAGGALEAGGRSFRPARTFSDVATGEGFWYENANGLAEFAVNGGRADALGLRVGTPVTL